LRTSNEAVVNLAAFVAAVVQRRIRRTRVTIRGARSRVPLDVLIYADGAALVIDTPTCAYRLPMRGTWELCASVSAAALAVAVSKIKAGEHLSLIFVAGSLVIDGGAFVLRAEVTPRPPPALAVCAPS
jgi:hypothetical protein